MRDLRYNSRQTDVTSISEILGVGNNNSIALFTVTFSHLHYNVFERGCEAISGNFAVSARNCLTSMFKYIVMQIRKVNCEKGYSPYNMSRSR